MTSLSDVIESVLLGSHSYSRIQHMPQRNSNTSAYIRRKYLEIPIDSNVFELPVLALDAFVDMLGSNKESDVLVAQLYSSGSESEYKSLDAIIKDTLSTPISRHLCKINVQNSTNVYYGTFGAVFNADMEPLMMLSWIMERRTGSDGKVMYRYKRPLLRLHPDPCVIKEDALQNLLAGRLLSKTLQVSVGIPWFRQIVGFIDQSRSFYGNSVRIEIDKSPFVIKETDTPSISLTNEALLQMAAEHMDEIMQ